MTGRMESGLSLFKVSSAKRLLFRYYGYWPGWQVGRLTTDTKDLQLLPLPHKVKALHCGELYQETLHA